MGIFFVPNVWLVFLSPLSIPQREKGEYVHCGGWELAASNKSAGRGQCGHANYSSPSTAGPKQETHLIHWKNAQGVK